MPKRRKPVDAPPVSMENDDISDVGVSGVRLPRYSSELNVRVSFSMLRKLEVIAAFEQIKVSDLLRGWFSDEFGEYGRDKRFQKWLGEQTENTRKVWWS